MIKRLKWNVLYAESAQDGSHLSDSSAESIERGSTSAQAVLDQLATNDPNFAAALGRQSYSCSSDEEDTHQQNVSAEHPAASKEEQLSNDSDDADYAEWRECDLCPGKRFLNDADVQTHLSSRHHKRALKRFEARHTPENDDNHAPNQRFAHANLQAFATLNNSVDIDHPQNPVSSRLADKTQRTPSLLRETENTQQTGEEDQPSPNGELKMTEEQQRKANKRKAAVKRRLLRLKQKKWKRTEQGQGSAEISEKKEEEQKLNDPVSEKGQKTDRKREKVRKISKSRAKEETQHPSEAKLNDHNAGAEASQFLQKRERKKSKRKCKETVGENGVNGSTKRKKLRRELETLTSRDVPQQHPG